MFPGIRNQSASEKKLVSVVVSILMALQMAVYFYIVMANRNIAMGALDTHLAVGAKAFGYAAAQRGNYLKTSADLLSKDYGFLDALGTDDRDTIESSLENLAGRLGARIAVLVDRNGEIVAKSFSHDYSKLAKGVSDDALERVVNRTREGKPNLYPIESDGESILFKWTRTVIRNPAPTSAVLFAFEINQDVLKEFRRTTNMEFSYVSNAPGEPWNVHASSLNWDTKNVIRMGMRNPMGRKWTEEFNGTAYRALAVDMNGDSDVRVVAIVATPTEAALAAFGRVEKVITIALVILCIASIITIRRSTKKIVAPLAAEARRDGLTSLENRRAFEIKARAAEKNYKHQGRGFAIGMMDLNKFKSINDTWGHAAGDEVLIEVARRIKPLLRNSDTVARLGGDEFAFVIHTNDMEKLQEIATKIESCIAQPITITGGQVVSVGSSMGMAICPRSGNTAAELLEMADAAMYAAKGRGGGFDITAPHSQPG